MQSNDGIGSRLRSRKKKESKSEEVKSKQGTGDKIILLEDDHGSSKHVDKLIQLYNATVQDKSNGTVGLAIEVDTEITHPNEAVLFLCAHRQKDAKRLALFLATTSWFGYDDDELAGNSKTCYLPERDKVMSKNILAQVKNYDTIIVFSGMSHVQVFEGDEEYGRTSKNILSGLLAKKVKVSLA